MSFDSAATLPLASGDRRDYALDPRPIATGGQATVFAATHKPSGRRVAFKRLDGRHPDVVARMRREIEAAELFGDHPHVMPVLDHSPAFDWFVMPLAEATALTLAADLSQTEALRDLVGAICEALRLPHQQGWIHRDLKPDNLLRLDGRWVVADWGLGRRPRGQTTDARRTRTGTAFGTEGFAAPELAVDAHAAGPQADIYSIGQIIGWALTGSLPHANIPLLPAGGPWRAVVKAATRHDSHDRVASVDDLLALVDGELDSPDAVADRGAQLLAKARDGDPGAPAALLRLAAQSGENAQILEESLLGLGDERTRAAVAADPATAAEMVRLLRAGPVEDAAAAAGPGALPWLLVVADHAERGEHWDLLDETIESVLVLSARAGDRELLAGVADWMGGRTGQAASSLASALRRWPAHPQVRELLAGRPGVDHRVARALRGPRGGVSRPAPRRGVRRRAGLVAGALVILVAIPVAGVALSQLGDRGSPGAGPSSGNPFAGLPKTPGELALFAMEDFVAPWDDYPSWAECRSGSGDTAVTGRFPAGLGEAITPSKSIHCHNGGNLTAMFAEFDKQADFDTVRGRYLAAQRPATKARGEADPPPGLHVFQWSPTQRAVVWTSAKDRLIGLLVTDSDGTDLVELWQRYQG
ncbi:protein kinase domain-containing protein [Phytohabitans sp. LJ34]|uniref:protein kinase domain-containing protein n=1 Tax=Phytohabitans sp. LJ34 TaxID=3452217 RepID=UPI003F8B1DA2